MKSKSPGLLLLLLLCCTLPATSNKYGGKGNPCPYTACEKQLEVTPAASVVIIQEEPELLPIHHYMGYML